MRILVVAAHPDDEVLGCGGSIAKWVGSGCEVVVLILAEGQTSRDLARDRELRGKELSNLELSARSAAAILGVKTLHLLDLPDNRMDALDLLDVVKIIESKVQEFLPEVVVTHHANDVNIDHQLIHQAVVTACRPQPNASVKKLLAFEVPSSTEWQPPGSASSFQPNFYIDISETLDVKMSALSCYADEMRPWPHARSLEGVRYLAGWRGASVGCEAAEAFQLLREIA